MERRTISRILPRDEAFHDALRRPKEDIPPVLMTDRRDPQLTNLQEYLLDTSKSEQTLDFKLVTRE